MSDKWLTGEIKFSILETLALAKSLGWPVRRTCIALQIDNRRIRRWQTAEQLANKRAGPIEAPHRLLPKEREAVLTLARNEELADDSFRILTIKGLETGVLAMSFSSVYRVMREAGLTTIRVARRIASGRNRKPERPDLTGPNQRWCWDISYLPTPIKGVFLYLYLIVDEFSRKAISWRVSQHQTAEVAKELFQTALESENLKKEAMPMIFNDRGPQMKAKSLVMMFQTLGMTQKFSRPRTPNDNPFVESTFSVVKVDPDFPDAFSDESQADIYFAEYFGCWYNTERKHGGIGFVTPVQKHDGLADAILAERQEKMKAARVKRLMVNRRKSKRKGGLTVDQKRVA